MVIVQRGPLLAMFPSVTHVVLREGIKTWGRRIGERWRGREREGHGGGNKVRNKECIHERRKMRVTRRQRRETEMMKTMLCSKQRPRMNK